MRLSEIVLFERSHPVCARLNVSGAFECASCQARLKPPNAPKHGLITSKRVPVMRLVVLGQISHDAYKLLMAMNFKLLIDMLYMGFNRVS